MTMRFADKRFLENSARDACLVGHDDDAEIRTIQQTDSVNAIGKEYEAVETIEIARFFEQRAVTIEKHGGAGHHLEAIRAATASNTMSDVIRFIHRWSIGQSRSMHGRQNTSRTMTS